MGHILIVVIMTAVIGFPVIWLQRRGAPGSKRIHEQLREELKEHGRVFLQPTGFSKMLGSGPLIIDLSGFTVGEGKNRRDYAWSDIMRPFMLHEGVRRSTYIEFYHREENPNFGRRKMFVNTTDQFIQKRKTIETAYSLGYSNLLNLLNEARAGALVKAA